MNEVPVDLMQYALGGASLFILIAVGFVAIAWKGLAKRDAKKEVKNKKKQEKRQQKKETKLEAKAQKQQSKKVVKPVAKAAPVVKEAPQAKAKVEAAPVVEEAPQVKAKVEATPEVKEAPQAQVKVEVTPEVKEVPQAQAKVEAAPVVGVKIPKFESAKEVEARLESEALDSQAFMISFYKMHTTNTDENKKFTLENALTIGRNPGYHHWTLLDDPTVSGNHCKIYQREGQIYILDLNSTNGTYINGQRVRGQIKLENHDKLEVGQSAYRIRIELCNLEEDGQSKA
ncbi:MAG: FHA domain-containing protein [Niameybacter sp.]